MKYLIAIDIGGTTFNCGLFSQSFKLIDISAKDKIRNYSNKNDVVCAMINQINSLIKSNKINKKNILGIGIASPGPLDSNNGIILETDLGKDGTSFIPIFDQITKTGNSTTAK